MAKVFVDMPPFSMKSNGVVCIYELYEFLFNKNLDLYFLPRDVLTIKFNVGSAPYNLSKYNFILSLEGANKNDWLIANDTTSKKHIKLARKIGLKIIWWQLAPYNFLGGKVFPKIGEINLPFSSCVDPYAKNFFYFQPPIDKYWKNAIKLSNEAIFEKDSITIYTGKGRIKKLPLEIRKLFRKYNINLISRTYPIKRSGMFKFLLKSIALITFDELTQLNLEAASIGLPVFVANKIFPDFVYEKFPVKSLGERVTSNPQHFLELLERSKNHKFNKFNKFNISDLIQNDKKTFNYIYEVLTQNDSLSRIGSEDLKRFKSWTFFLKNKNMIHPHLNGGQSAGSLFINKYCSNLINQKNSALLQIRILIFEEICKFLFDIKLLQIFLFITRKVSDLLLLKKIINKYNSLKRFLIYRFDKNNANNLFHENSNIWSNNKLSIDQIMENADEKVSSYDDMIFQNDLGEINKIAYIRFSNNKSEKNKLKSIQNIFENSYLSFPKSIPLKIRYKLFKKDD